MSKEVMEDLSERCPLGTRRRRYCELTELNRTNRYYKCKGEKEENLRIIRKMDEYYQAHPTVCTVTMSNMLRLQGLPANPKRVSLLRKMGLLTIHPQRTLGEPDQAAYVYPYLLRGLKSERRNKAWNTDISYIPMERGFMGMYAIIDVYSRIFVGWRQSNTLESSNCVELLVESVRKYGRPEIVNTDQGSQYTSPSRGSSQPMWL